jgi:hypothetical protein
MGNFISSTGEPPQDLEGRIKQGPVTLQKELVFNEQIGYSRKKDGSDALSG